MNAYFFRTAPSANCSLGFRINIISKNKKIKNLFTRYTTTKTPTAIITRKQLSASLASSTTLCT